MFFYVAALYFFYRCGRTTVLLLFLASASTALAILVKPTSIHVGLIFALLATQRFGWPVIKDCESGWLDNLSAAGALYYWHATTCIGIWQYFWRALRRGQQVWQPELLVSPGFYELGQNGSEIGVYSSGGADLPSSFYQSLRRRQTLLLFSVITIGIYYLIVARYSGYARGEQYHIYMVPLLHLVLELASTISQCYRHRRLGTLVGLCQSWHRGMVSAVVCRNAPSH